MPAAAVRRAEPLAMGASALPVGCSNYGDLPAAVVRLDGRDSNDFWVRLIRLGRVRRTSTASAVSCPCSAAGLGNVFLSIVARPVGGGLGGTGLLCHIRPPSSEFGP
ncbi:MAG: hypothetical protein IPF88_14230 [Candidatus Microthrix sp.]|nr:hypothetical protein [Candidatus Microthrix sp.]MBK6439704.1 hypothetical protein [Candidatus Microthrix sp.]